MATQRIGREEWLEAALNAWLRGGITQVAVESLARTLGVTKGSFYWHFEDREELVRAALALWEQRAADEPIALLEQLPAEDRVDAIFAFLGENVPLIRGESAIRSVLHLPQVAQVVASATRKRLRFLEKAYAALGLNTAEARSWAALGLGGYMGTIDLLAAAPDRFPDDDSFGEYLRHAARVLGREAVAASKRSRKGR